MVPTEKCVLLVQERLKQRGWNQSDLAERLGESRAWVSSWLKPNATVRINAKRLCQIAAAFDESAEVWGAEIQRRFYGLSQPPGEVIMQHSGISFEQFCRYANRYWLDHNPQISTHFKSRVTSVLLELSRTRRSSFEQWVCFWELLMLYCGKGAKELDELLENCSVGREDRRIIFARLKALGITLLESSISGRLNSLSVNLQEFLIQNPAEISAFEAFLSERQRHSTAVEKKGGTDGKIV